LRLQDSRSNDSIQQSSPGVAACTVAQATPTAAADNAADLAKATQNCATLLQKAKSQPYNFTLSEEKTYAKAINKKLGLILVSAN
jgi:hypothetical protein